VNDSACSKEVFFNVKKVNYHVIVTRVVTREIVNLFYKRQDGDMQYRYKVGVRPPTGETEGINFKAWVSVPKDFNFPQGQWQAVQRLLNQGAFKKAVDGICKANPNGNNAAWALDNSYPYKGPWDSLIEPDKTTHLWGDTPTMIIGVRPEGQQYFPPKWSDARIRDDFQMHIMFKPGSPNSEWVPIAVINWYWLFCVYRTGAAHDNWSFGTDGAGNQIRNCQNDPPADNYEHPGWNAVYNNNAGWIDVTCPTFCRP
jgi:hypothetical protein